MQAVAVQTPKHRKGDPKLITSKDQIPHEYPGVFEGIGTFLGPSYHIQIYPNVASKQTPCPNPCTSERGVQARNKQDVVGRSTCTTQ